jgi:hypothetical protein
MPRPVPRSVSNRGEVKKAGSGQDLFPDINVVPVPIRASVRLASRRPVFRPFPSPVPNRASVGLAVAPVAALAGGGQGGIFLDLTED